MSQERLWPEAPTPEVPTEEPTPTSPTRPATRREQARLYKPVRNQVEMMLRDLDSLLPEDHLARAIWAFVERLDLSAFYAPIEAIVGEPGHPATDPQVLVALWVYATADGIGKARQLDRLCHEHDAYRWLRGGVVLSAAKDQLPHALRLPGRARPGSQRSAQRDPGGDDGRGAGES